MKKHILAAALTVLTAQAFAADYFVVVPMPNRAATTDNILVTLNPYSLPGGLVGELYPGFDFSAELQVRGDPSYTPAGVHWTLAGGSLPAGLTLTADGKLSGTPTTAGTSSFLVMAAYKTRAGEQGYQVVIVDINVSLAPETLPAAKIGDSYAFDFKPALTVSGDAAYSGSGVTWSLAGALPAGLSLDAVTGVVGGVPTVTGTQAFTVQASYRARTAQQAYSVQVNPRGLALQPDGSRTWDDGSVAQSCKSYRTGGGIYSYTGDTGDGTYRIQPPGMAALNVYCDMTTDGGGWMLAAWNKGNSGLANMPSNFFVSQVNPANIANRGLTNTSSSINVEAISKALSTSDVMLQSATYSSSPIIEDGQGVWSYDQPDCSGAIGHTGRNAGCSNHEGNDNYDTVDRFNIAIYSGGNTAIVPGWLNAGNELCWENHGWCDFEFYLR